MGKKRERGEQRKPKKGGLTAETYAFFRIDPFTFRHRDRLPSRLARTTSRLYEIASRRTHTPRPQFRLTGSPGGFPESQAIEESENNRRALGLRRASLQRDPAHARARAAVLLISMINKRESKYKCIASSEYVP